MRDALRYTKNILEKGDLEKIRVIVFNTLSESEMELTFGEKLNCWINTIPKEKMIYKKTITQTEEEMEDIYNSLEVLSAKITYLYDDKELVGFSKLKKEGDTGIVYICHLDNEYKNYYDSFVKEMTKELPASNSVSEIKFVLPNVSNEDLIRSLLKLDYELLKREEDSDRLVFRKSVPSRIRRYDKEEEKNGFTRKRRNTSN